MPRCMHYLKAVDKAGGAADGKAVVAAMKAMPTDDPLFGKGIIRADGRKIHPLYLLEVKKPDESTSKWDLLKVVATIPGDQAFRPESEGNCPLSRSERERSQRLSADADGCSRTRHLKESPFRRSGSRSASLTKLPSQQ